VPYGERDDLHFKAERDESRRELGEFSKKACIAELEWERIRVNNCWRLLTVYPFN
jgi:hypothetical protein